MALPACGGRDAAPAGARAVGARVPAGAWCAARRGAGAGPGRVGVCWTEGCVTWPGELVASGSPAPRHLPGSARTGSPAKGRGRRTGAGRGAPGRIRVVSPRGNLRHRRRAGGNEGGRRESVAPRAPRLRGAGPWHDARRGGCPQQRAEDCATRAPFTPGPRP